MACISLLPHVLSLQILQRVYWQTKVAYNASSYGVMDPNATFAISEPQQLANIALFAISRRSPREWSLTRIWHTRSHSSSVPAATSWSAIFGIYVITWLWYTINSVVLLSARNSSVLDATTGPRPMSDDKSTTTSNRLKSHIAFWTSISLSGMPPPSKNKHIPQLSPVLTVIFDANKMCYTSPLIDHNQTLVPTFSLSAPIKWVCCRGAQPKEPPRRSPSLNYNDWFIDWISFKCPTVDNISHLSKKASNAEIPSESSHVAETSCLHPPLSVLFINLKANSLVASNCIRSFWRISWPFFRPYG